MTEDERERERLSRAVALAGTIAAAAKAEGVTRQALQQRIRRLGGKAVTGETRIEWESSSSSPTTPAA